MAFKMKAGKEGPMYKNFPSAFKDEKKGTKLVDKMKAAGGAIKDTFKEMSGPDDTLVDQAKNFLGNYKKRKKESRKQGAK